MAFSNALLSRTYMKHIGLGLVWYYKDSILAAVEAEYPEHRWRAWNFSRLPQDYWTDLAARFALDEPKALEETKDYLKDVAEAYGVATKHSSEFRAQLMEKITNDTNKDAVRTIVKRLAHFGGLEAVLDKLTKASEVSMRAQIEAPSMTSQSSSVGG